MLQLTRKDQSVGIFSKGISHLREHKRAYVILNVAFYGAMVAMTVVGHFYPELKDAMQRSSDPNSDPTNHLFQATYGEGRVLAAASITFAVNLGVGAVITQTFPSLIIPMFGVVAGFLRVASWGLIFAPSGFADAPWFIPHGITAAIEAQAYVLAAFAAYVQADRFFRFKAYGLASRGQGYKQGLFATLHIYVLIVAVLMLAALWEAIELIHIVPDSFLQWWLGH